MKVSIPRAWTVGKSISFDPEAGARAEAAVAALAAQISAGLGGSILHRNLQQLQVGDDHPQYAGNSFPETITGQWNFQTIPLIQGDTLAEYIEDVVGGSFFDFLQDTTSVVWTYHETANELEANVPPEFVQDTVGAMLTDTASIDLAYNDGLGTFTASIIDEYVQDLVDALMIDSTSIAWTYGDVGNTLSAATINANPSGLIGMSAVNGTAATPLRSDGRHAIDPAIAPTWTGQHTYTSSFTIWDYADNTYAMSVRGATGRFLVRPYIDATYGVGFEATNTAQTLNIPLTFFGSPVNIAPTGGVIALQIDGDSAAGNTRLLVYDVDNGALERVSVGVADSGGTGFKVLRIPN